MKIHFDNVNFSTQSGPNTFARRLASALIENHHDVSNSADGADISLVFIERSGVPLAKKFVHRLDGIWFSPHEYKHRNKNIKATFDAADAVVWQSEFNRRQISGWWGDKEHSAVIHNGIKISPVTKFTSPELEQIRRQYDKVFVCSSNWHPQKRLRANIDMYHHLRDNVLEEKCCLFILGQGALRATVYDPHIFYANSIPEDIYMQVYSMADWMIHLAYLDHCPNVVVECLSQETPVICSSDGGARELVAGYGKIIQETVPYDFTLKDYDNPPPIDVEQLEGLPFKESLSPHVDIDITNVAKKYIELFESIL
jgi:glycosyltransferase involved in cell wall biosynthesis